MTVLELFRKEKETQMPPTEFILILNCIISNAGFPLTAPTGNVAAILNIMQKNIDINFLFTLDFPS